MKNLKVIGFVLMCFNFSFANAIVKEDSLKSRFEINDPRNPNCPCHKYQKLADDEYRIFLAKENRIVEESENSFLGNNNANGKSRSANKKKYFKQKHRSFFNTQKKKRIKKKKVRRLRRDNASCFHF